MSTPRLICKSGYMKSITYVLNTLEYSGNKFAEQEVLYKDGSVERVSGDKIVKLSPAQQNDVAGIRLYFKDGGSLQVSYSTYVAKTELKTENLRVSEIENVRDDELEFHVADGPHEMKDLDFFRYINYIEDREGVEKHNGHGLFGLSGDIDIDEAKMTAELYSDCRAWSHIISLDTQDAIDTGYNNRTAWQDLIISKAPEIAKAYNISLNNLVINCAYHDNTDNPHVHLVFYSRDKTEGFLKGGKKGLQKATEKLKSTLVNSIFKDESLRLDERKYENRKEIKAELQRSIHKLLEQESNHELVSQLMSLGEQLEAIEGKTDYGYLSPALKSQVDETLYTAIFCNETLKKLYADQYKVQEEMITRYSVAPEVIAQRLEQYQNHFFHPQKGDLRIFHNAVIEAAKKANTLSHQWVRTTEEEIFDYAPLQSALSSDTYDVTQLEPPPEDTDWLTPPPLDLVNLRTTEEKIFNDTPDGNSLSSNRSSVISKGLGATGEKNTTVTYADISKLLKENQCSLNYGIGTAFRRSLRGLWNPLAPKTLLQQEMANKLMEHRTLPPDDCNDSRSELYRLLYSSDTPFREDVERSLEQAHQLITKEFSLSVANDYISGVRIGLQNGDRFHLSGIDQYTRELDDYRYYDLLSAFQDFGKPLNKAMFKALKETVVSNPQFIPALREIGELSEYLELPQAKEMVQSEIKIVLDHLKDNPEFFECYEEYVKNYHKKIHEYMPEVSEQYCKRFSNTLSNVLQLMRPHYSVLNFGKQGLDDCIYQSVVSDKALLKPINKLLYKTLRDCLTDTEGFSAELIRQKLMQIRDDNSPTASNELIRYLYSTSPEIKQVFDNHFGTIYEQLKKQFEPEMAGEYLIKYQESLFQSTGHSPIQFFVQCYGKSYGENVYQAVLFKNRDLWHDLNSTIAKSLWKNSADKRLAFLIRRYNDFRVRYPDQEQLLLKAKKEIRLFLFDQQDPVNAEKLYLEQLQSIRNTLLQEMKLLTVSDPNLQLELESRLDSDMTSGDSNCGGRYVIDQFCEEYENIPHHSIARILLCELAQAIVHYRPEHEQSNQHQQESRFTTKKQFRAEHFPKQQPIQPEF